ncbi:MAG: hypothetical protein V1798_05915 [Pseudomonadota bacterium]
MKQICAGSLWVCLLGVVTGAFAQGEQQPKPTAPVPQWTIYGSVKADLIAEEPAGSGPITLYAPPSTPSQHQHRFTYTLRQTRVGLVGPGPQVLGGKTSNTVEMDWYGTGGTDNTATPRLYRAFIKGVWPTFDVLAGQDWDLSSRLYAKTVIFFMPPAGNPQYRRPQLRAVKSFPMSDDQSGFSLAGALVQPPQRDLDNDGMPDGDASGLPMLEGRMAFERYKDKGFRIQKHDKENDPSFTLAASGHVGREEIWTGSAGMQTFRTWSVTGEACLPLPFHSSFKCEVYRGDNLGFNYGGISQGPIKKKNGTFADVHDQGGWGQLEINTRYRTFKDQPPGQDPVPTLQFHVGGGIDQPRAEDLSPGDRSRNIACYANVYYQIATALTFAAEQVQYQTRYLGGETANLSRTQVSCTLGPLKKSF